MFTLDQLEAAAALVYRHMPPTPQYAWPLLAEATGVELWVKHENHTPAGAFKIRGGLVYVDRLRRTRPDVRAIVTATRGNHGQSLALAGSRAGLAVTIVVPESNSAEKNALMRAFGAEVVAVGRDFDAAREAARAIAERQGALMVPSFDPALVLGVATYALEFFRHAGPLDTVYVPIGLGSGICGLIRTRDLLGLSTEIVGVVAAGAPAYRLSFEAGRVIATERALTFADGMACRVPEPDALAIIQQGAARVLELDEAAIAAAVRLYFGATHNVAEGAGAAPLAALLQERAAMAGKRVGLILCGGNIDTDKFACVLAGGVPKPF
ncbi:MAG: threonine dehydratase [Geminicoccaceae bacterium]|nr:MAG: threonine dehydratase [Geminicoccaceae bacterium]